MTKRTMKSYTQEFKQSSSQLAIDSDQPVAQTARELGISDATLYAWVAKYRTDQRSKSNNQDATSQELQRLRKENARLKQERDILKKAAAYFASEI